MSPSFCIEGRPLGAGHPPYVVAELSANHLGERERAFAIIEQAHQAGADAIKLQTYTPDGMTLDLEGPGFSLESGPWKGRRLYELYAEAQTPWEWHEDLFAFGRSLGLTVFSSPFDRRAVDLLASLDAPAYKIASFELVDHELIGWAAQTGRPVILSTGMARLEEVQRAVAVARSAGAEDIAVLHCVSGYPTPTSSMNLSALHTLAEELDVVLGLSDHSLGRIAPIAAVALGACLFEKHLTLSRADGGPDAGFSLEPNEFAELVRDVRTTWEALGDGRVEPSSVEDSSLSVRRSLYVVRDLEAGETFRPDDLRSIRPALGLEPRFLPEVLGRPASRAIKRGEPLCWDLVGDAP